MDQLQFESIPAVVVTGFGTETLNICRAKVTGGWLVLNVDSNTLMFYPDPEHKWTGTSEA